MRATNHLLASIISLLDSLQNAEKPQAWGPANKAGALEKSLKINDSPAN